MRLAILALPLGLLAACSQAPNDKARTTTPPPTILGGVDLSQPLRALGTEPFWSLEIGPDGMVYTGLERETERAETPSPEQQGTTATYTTTTDQDHGLTATLIATECSDGMSERVYPLTVKIEIGEQTLNGCAASVAWLNAQPAP